MSLITYSKADLFPSWMSAQAKTILQSGRYLDEGESLRDRYMDICLETSSLLGLDDTFVDALFHCLFSGWIGLASAVLSNYGKNQGLPVSCNLLYMDDSIQGIYNCLEELAVLSKQGAGVSVFVGDVRGSGAPISTGGISQGIAYPAKLIETTGNYVSQNGRITALC